MKKIAVILATMLILAGCSEDDPFNPDKEINYSAVSILFNKNVMKEMITGESRPIMYTVAPAEADDNIIWSSDNEGVASVSGNGIVTAVSLGIATITATSDKNPSVAASCEVSVTSQAGISVVDYLLQEPVSGTIEIIRGAEPREYIYSAIVYGTMDNSVTVTSDKPNLLEVIPCEIDGLSGFSLVTGTDIGEGLIVLESKIVPDVRKEIPFRVITTNVEEVYLGLEPDRSDATSAFTGEVTVGHSFKIYVKFDTNFEGVQMPENSKLICSSSDTGILTIDPYGTIDPVTGLMYINANMIDDVNNAGKSCKVTVTTDDGGKVATADITAKIVPLTGLKLNQTLSRPVLAGDTILLEFSPVPADAYFDPQKVTWTTEDVRVADVYTTGDATARVDVDSNLSFDPDNLAQTEKSITVTSDQYPAISASCKLRPYRYVEPTGVMVTDQWGNRIKGFDDKGLGLNNKTLASQQSPVGTENRNLSACYIMGQASGGAFGSANSAAAWTKPSGTTCIPNDYYSTPTSLTLYLTATPYPYEYPRISNPETTFYWTSPSDTRMVIPAADDPFATDPTGQATIAWTPYSASKSSNTGNPAVLYEGRTCMYFTGRGSNTSSDFMRILIYMSPTGANDTQVSKKLMFSFFCHVTKDGNEKLENQVPNMWVDPGNQKTVHLFKYFTPLDHPYDDPAPWPWTGPLPEPEIGPKPTTIKQAASDYYDNPRK